MARINIPSKVVDMAYKQINATNKLLSKHLKVSQKVTYINDTVVKDEEDTRLCLIQCVESIVFITAPYFDKKMEEDFEEAKVYLSGFGYEILESIKDEKLKKKIEGLDKIKKKDRIRDLRVRKAKELFSDIIMFIQRTNLLKDKIEEDKHGTR